VRRNHTVKGAEQILVRRTAPAPLARCHCAYLRSCAAVRLCPPPLCL
jgi:hypothetical protein